MVVLELYHHGSSTCAAKVRFALAEKAIAYRSHYVDLLKGENFRPEYLKLNPQAVVPTLVHEGVVLVESTVIREYLEDEFPPGLFAPSAPLAAHGCVSGPRRWTRSCSRR